MSFLEIFVIFLIALVVLGPDKLPEAARWLGKTMRELRRASNLMRDTLMLDELSADSALSTPERRHTKSDASPPRSLQTDGARSLDQIDEMTFDDARFDEVFAQAMQLDTDPRREIDLPLAASANSFRRVELADRAKPSQETAQRRVELTPGDIEIREHA